MPSKLVAWDRLVRYIPENSPSSVRYGEPIVADDETDRIAQIVSEGKLKVKKLQGDHPLDARPTEEVETVKTLLGPLEAADVPIIRCIGLNYKTHSKCRFRECEKCQIG